MTVRDWSLEHLGGAAQAPDGGGAGDDDAEESDPRRTLLEAFNALAREDQETILEALSQVLKGRSGGTSSGSSDGFQDEEE